MKMPCLVRAATAPARFLAAIAFVAVATPLLRAAHDHGGTASPSLPPSTQRMVERLAKLEEAVDPLSNPFFTGKLAAYYRERLAEAKDPEAALPLRMPAAVAFLNDGQIIPALRQIDELDRGIAQYNVPMANEDIAKIVQLRAVCLLRLAEQENCIDDHNADSCLLPIAGGGIHKKQRGARAAITVLKDLLDHDPNPYGAWLYNIAYMLVGEYPHKVPERWLIPPKVFESDYDIKRFPDVAPALGLDVDDLSGGVVMDDFDNDGWLDLMVSASGFKSQIRLFRNDGNGRFTERTKEALLTGLMGGLNLLQADYDNDGDIDVLVLRGGWLGKDGRWPPSLLRNNGDFTFTDVTEEAGLLTLHPRQTATWLDYNLDGAIDLFVGNETVPDSGAVDACELFRNNGDGTFAECAEESGIALVAWVKAVTSGDYNNDGRPDIYASTLDGANRLFLNQGPADGERGPKAKWRFSDVAAKAGVLDPDKSFPCWFWDYNNDGWLDLFVSGYSITNAGDIAADYLGVPTKAERPRLFRNKRDGTFEDVTKAAGLWKVLETMGSNFGDLDSDGWLDFYVGTGDPYLGTLIPNRMFRNDGNGGFQDVTTSGGFGQLQKGHGIAYGDLNGDGTQDVYSVVGGAFGGDHYHNQLFANPGHGNRWVKLKLEGVRTNRAAMGARIKVVVKTKLGSREIHRVVTSGGSFGASPLQQEIGLGDASAVDRVEITWPVTGETQVVKGLKLDSSYHIREGTAAKERPKLATFAWPSPDERAPHQHAHHGSR